MTTPPDRRRRLAAVLMMAVLASCTTADPDTNAATSSSPEVAAEPEPSAAPRSAPPLDDGLDHPLCGGPVERVDTFEYRTIAGVDPGLLSLDVHRSAAASGCPVVIYVHGGSWQAGDKATTATSVKATHLNAAGFVFVSVNYRLVAEDNDVRWPSFGEDVASAVDWVVANAEELGIDADHVSLMGHSAGAHLVSIVGTNPDLLGTVGRQRSEVSCVVSLDSVDHTLADAPTYEREIVGLAFGDDPAVLADGSPTAQAREHDADGDASDSLPDFLIVTRGREARLQSSDLLREALVDAGSVASVLDVSPYDHRDANVRFGEPGETLLTDPVTDFLLGCSGT